MDVIDAIIHLERLDKNGLKKTFNAILTTLPDGSFITFDEMSEAYLWFEQNLYKWSFDGYTQVVQFDKNHEVNVLTPLSYIAVFKAGYVPQVHFSVK